eukprot:scaffold375_cov189-Skeletonema_marinoi.AAC.14
MFEKIKWKQWTMIMKTDFSSCTILTTLPRFDTRGPRVGMSAAVYGITIDTAIKSPGGRSGDETRKNESEPSKMKNTMSHSKPSTRLHAAYTLLLQFFPTSTVAHHL